MRRFIRISIKIAVVLIVLMVLVVLYQEYRSITEQRRQPLNVQITDRESPFSVPERQENTRRWINERLNP